MRATFSQNNNLDYINLIVGEVNITGISADGTGKAVCIKADRNLGTCSDAVGGSGTCTCG